MALLGMWVWLTKPFIAKEIQKCIFADSSKHYIDLLVDPRLPKNKMVAMETKLKEKETFKKKKNSPINSSHAALTRVAEANGESEGRVAGRGRNGV